MSPLSEGEIHAQLDQLEGWEYTEGRLRKGYAFANHYETIAFVNAVAWISHRQDHHPDLQVGYNRCVVSYHSHDIQGISGRDFDCAAKVDALFNI